MLRYNAPSSLRSPPKASSYPPHTTQNPPLASCIRDQYDDEARRDEDARDLQFESFPIGCSMWGNRSTGKWWPIERSRSGQRLGEDGVRMWDVATMVWLERGPKLMLFFFSRNWRVLIFQTALEEGKRLLSYFSDETCNASLEGEGYQPPGAVACSCSRWDEEKRADEASTEPRGRGD